MLKIRLQRVGRKHEPTFRLVLTDSKNGPKSGKSLEVLGAYDSRRGDKADVKVDRVKYWMAQGAQLSDTVHNMLVESKAISGKKINVLPLKTAIPKEVVAEVPASTPAEISAPASEAEVAPVETPAPEAPVAELVAEALASTPETPTETPIEAPSTDK